MLRTLSGDDWQRTGIHEERGEIVLIDIVRSIAEHEEEHLAQLLSVDG